jgi:hypothetical protein
MIAESVGYPRNNASTSTKSNGRGKKTDERITPTTRFNTTPTLNAMMNPQSDLYTTGLADISPPTPPFEITFSLRIADSGQRIFCQRASFINNYSSIINNN